MKILKQNDKVNHPVGETLPKKQRVYRVRVLKSFFHAAVPLRKILSETFWKKIDVVYQIAAT